MSEQVWLSVCCECEWENEQTIERLNWRYMLCVSERVDEWAKASTRECICERVSEREKWIFDLYMYYVLTYEEKCTMRVCVLKCQ